MTTTIVKFRGFRTDGNGWVEGDLAYMFNNPKHSCIMPSCYFATRDFGEEDEKGNPILEDSMALGGFIPVVPESVGMFTGRTDKNGCEIYGAIGENGGDVVKDFQGHIFTCIFNGIRFDMIDSDGCSRSVYYHQPDVFWLSSDEIIGNQWEVDNGK